MSPRGGGRSGRFCPAFTLAAWMAPDSDCRRRCWRCLTCRRVQLGAVAEPIIVGRLDRSVEGNRSDNAAGDRPATKPRSAAQPQSRPRPGLRHGVIGAPKTETGDDDAGESIRAWPDQATLARRIKKAGWAERAAAQPDRGHRRAARRHAPGQLNGGRRYTPLHIVLRTGHARCPSYWSCALRADARRARSLLTNLRAP
jgi:hypothetical protein